ncbi:hypothetical protein FB45DRAFT_742753 [Roridomyces roridus]|uniref:SWIM-type domain-containing protein n=1 Tax=Roridomyces roridus TaxID=1738132 RepID=A0AAD7C0W6_9AGAR|nr:hypothetical protein FB45DRAFT_742753 [Roridomyces roridus]
MSREEANKSIQFGSNGTVTKLPQYEAKTRYVCTRGGTGGKKAYIRTAPKRARKIASKRTECGCSLTVKRYPGRTTVLGRYIEDHDHPLGRENLPYTRIPKETREFIAGMLRLKVSSEKILEMVLNGVYDNDDFLDRDDDETMTASRTEFIQLRDIRKIEKDIEAETIRLHPDDGQSTIRWVANLREKGIPVAWMLASSGTADTIHYFLSLVKLRSPTIIPRHIMTDFDKAQINACRRAWGTALTVILLCWWHVLHAWQQRFKIEHNEALWVVLKQWPRMTTQQDFDAAWQKIQQMAPSSFVTYLKEVWMDEAVVKMWSAIYRKDRSIFEQSDTNMLVEAYRRQDCGFEGPDIESKKRQDIILKAKVYSQDEIKATTDSRYIVPSKSSVGKSYDVDLDKYTCTCADYPLINFCKHICAVQTLFGEVSPEGSSTLSPHVPSLTSLPPRLIRTRSPTASLRKRWYRSCSRRPANPLTSLWPKSWSAWRHVSVTPARRRSLSLWRTWRR